MYIYVYIYRHECIYMSTYSGAGSLQKSPTFSQKSPMFLQNRLAFSPKAPYSFTRSSQYFFSQELNYHLVLGLVCKGASALQKSHTFSQKSPYPVTRAPHSLKRDPWFSIFSQKNSIIIYFLA